MKEQIPKNNEWHWFKGGILVSVLSMATYVVFQALSYKSYPFGITSGFGTIATLFKQPFPGLSENPVIQKFSNSPAAPLAIALIIGVIIGGFVAARRSNTYQSEFMPSVWTKYHGSNIWKRSIVVIVGGFLLGWGAVLASGCTTGNILQGWAHLSLGSLVAGSAFFVAAIATANILYSKRRRA